MEDWYAFPHRDRHIADLCAPKILCARANYSTYVEPRPGYSFKFRQVAVSVEPHMD